MPITRQAALDLFPRLRGAGCTLSIDIGHHAEWLRDPRNWQTCGEVDFFMPNAKEGQIMVGSDQPEEVLAGLAAKGIEGTVLKLGRAGAAAWHQGRVYRAEALALEPVDTTGAGDAFDAGFIDALLDRAELPQMLQRACLCGSLSTRQAGALAALPGREELNQYYGRNYDQTGQY